MRVGPVADQEQRVVVAESFFERLEALAAGLALPFTSQISGASPSRPALGPAEARITELIAAGRSVREIATELGLSRSVAHRRIKALAADKLGGTRAGTRAPVLEK